MTSTNDGAMTRRGVLANAGAGASVAALGSASASAQTGAPKTFILVHGAWHGGWCWRRVADLLQKRGHKVFTPTLTGVGERSHLMSKDIVLDTHITDIVNVIKWEDLNNICLVVHSYGGWPGSPFSTAVSRALRLKSEAKSNPRWPFSGLNASSHTIEEMRSSACSIAPEPGQPP